MTISFDRSICCDLNESIAREWLVTNGRGGYAAGTVAGVLTRRQHGMLVAPAPHAATPQLLVAKIDEEVLFDQKTYYLGTNEYRDGTFSPAGFVHLEAFRLEEGFPIFTYRLGGLDGIILEKRIWMVRGQNTTCIQYRALRTTTTEKPGYTRSGLTGVLSAFERNTAALAAVQQEQQTLTINLLPLVANRPHNSIQHGNSGLHYQIHAHHAETSQATGSTALHIPAGVAGCTVQASSEAQPYHLLAVGHPESQATFIPTGVWYWHFRHRQNATNDQETDDFYLPGVIRAILWPAEEATITLIISCEEIAKLPNSQTRLSSSYKESVERQQEIVQKALQPASYFGEGGESAQAHHLRVLPLSNASDPYASGQEYLWHLIQASDRFLVQQKMPYMARNAYGGSYVNKLKRTDQQTILLADYFSMEQRTRDTLIALPGLTLVTGRYEEAQHLLQGLARYFLSGMLPDRLPTVDLPLTDSDYGSADTTLWYFYALDYYLRSTHDYQFLEEIYHHLKESIHRYVQGTYNGVQLDSNDGLLAAHKAGKALTWMNAYVQGTPITPRAGKAVEINALWYHALSLMHEWSQHLSHTGVLPHNSAYYHHLLIQCERSFQQRFWYAEGGYLYDVIDGMQGNDNTLRPNQLFALSLRYPVLKDRTTRQKILTVINQYLLTEYGLRTLAPQDAAYQGQVAGKRGRGKRPDDVQKALHQGSIWPWLIGPYIDAMLSKWSQPEQGQEQHLFQEYQWRKGLRLLEPFQDRLKSALSGTCEGVLNIAGLHDAQPLGDMLASALSIGELLRSYTMLAQHRAIEPQQVMSY